MPLESATYINSLDPANPAPTDLLNQADDHIRLIKSVLKTTFPNISGPVTASQDTLNSPFSLAVGSIVMWYGSSGSVPAGWALCDGRTVTLSAGGGTITTPDLRDRVPIGIGSFAPTLGQTIGNSTATGVTGIAGSHAHTVDGGAHTHTGQVLGTALTVGQMPSHSHFAFAAGTGGFGGGLNAGSPAWQNTENGNSGSAYLGAANGSTATVGITSPTGGGQSHDHGLTIDATAHTHNVSTSGDHQHGIALSTIQPALAVHFIMKV